MKNIKINKKGLNIIGTILQFLLSIIMVWSIFKLIVCSVYYNFISILYCILCIISIFGIIANIIIFYLRDKKIEKIFLMIAIPLGMVFLFLQLPSYKPDEPHHFYKSYAISTGDFIHARDENGVSQIKVPRDLAALNGTTINTYKKMDEVLFKKCNYDDTVVIPSTAANYNPIAYIFSSLGFFIGRKLNLSIFLSIFLSRFMNYLFYLIMGYWILKIMPIGKRVMLLLLMSPMMLQQSTAVTADVIMNMLALFFIAYLLHIRFEKDQVNYIDIFILLFCLIITCLIKIVYLPLVLVMACLLWNNIKKNKKMMIIIIAAVLVSIIGYLVVSMIYSYRNEEIYYNPLVNGKEQIKYVITHPFSYLKILNNTLVARGNEYITSMVGNYLAWYDLKYKGAIVVLYLIFMGISTFEKSKYELKPIEKIITIFTFLIIFNIMFLGIYIEWNAVGNSTISGIQGRYFIPFIALLILPFISKKNNIEFLNKKVWIYQLFIIISNIYLLYNMIPLYF